MKTLGKFRPLTLAVTLLLGMPVIPLLSVAQTSGQRSSRVAFTHALPSLRGDKLAVDIVEVAYGAGAVSPPHSHPCPVIVYVLEGAVRSQVKGQPEAVYQAGQSFYEAPNGVHLVAGNASDAQPAKFLAFFVCDHDAPLSAPVQGTAQ